jgi:replicative DNA helicase
MTQSFPAAVDVERGVLGSVMTDKNALKYGIEVLDDECFYDENHRKIWTVICELHSRGAIPEIVAVADALQRKEWLVNVGGEAYLAELAEKVATSANIVYHCRTLIEKAILRGCSQTMANGAKYACQIDADAEKVLGTVEKRVLQYRKRLECIGGEKVYDHDGAVNRFMGKLEARMAGGQEVVGLPWPVAEMNRVIGVAEYGHIYLFCGYEKGGKSRFTRCAISHWLNDGHPGILFITEETDEDVIKCVMGQRVRVNTKNIHNGQISQSEYQMVQHEVPRLKQQPIVIYVEPKLSPATVRRVCEREAVNFIKQGKRLEWVAVDTVQKMIWPRGSQSKSDMHEDIAKELECITKEFNVAMIEVMQFLSETERGTKTKTSLHAYIRYGKAYRESADAVVVFDDRRKSKKEIEAEKERGYRIVRAHVLEREGDSHCAFDLKAELQFSNYLDRADDDAVFEEPKEEKANGDKFFDGVEEKAVLDVPRDADGKELF